MSQKQEERRRAILQRLTQGGRVEVASLAGLLGVSQVTVRKDLDELESRGFIRRAHGSAELNSPDNVSGRLAYHYEEKRRIALRAVDLVADGDTVMIESGSCCALLAALLAQAREDLTIVTNSAFIAEYVRVGRAQVVLLGGIYQRASQCLVGPLVRETAAQFHVGRFFLGTDGWSPETGFTNRDQLRAQAVRDMAASAEELVVLTESEKFSLMGPVPLRVPGQPGTVITDGGVPAQALACLREQGVRVIPVEAG